MRAAHGLPARRTRRYLVARKYDARLMAALAAVPLAHQAPRPIRAEEVLRAMDLPVHDAFGSVIDAHEPLAAGAADGFIPADGLVEPALAIHHAFKAQTTLALGGAGVTPNRMRGAHHLAAGAARAEAGAANRMAPGTARACVRGAMRLATRGTGLRMRVARGFLIDVTLGDAVPRAELVATHPARLPAGVTGRVTVAADQQLLR